MPDLRHIRDSLASMQGNGSVSAVIGPLLELCEVVAGLEASRDMHDAVIMSHKRNIDQLHASRPATPTADALAKVVSGLREENERLTKERDRYDSWRIDAMKERDEARDERDDCAGQLATVTAERDALLVRRDELLALVARVTNETPFPDELKGWTEQRAKLVAEIGTLKAERDGVERNAVSAIAAYLYEQCGRWQEEARRGSHTCAGHDAEQRAAAWADAADAVKAGSWRAGKGEG